MAMPVGFPTSEDFDAAQVHSHDVTHHWERSPGRGGKNVGADFLCPAGSLVVDFEVHEHSRHSTKGNPDTRVVLCNNGPINTPIGVHNGIRLTPGGIGGPGASYKFTIKMRIVTKADWYAKFLSGVVR